MKSDKILDIISLYVISVCFMSYKVIHSIDKGKNVMSFCKDAQ